MSGTVRRSKKENVQEKAVKKTAAAKSAAKQTETKKAVSRQLAQEEEKLREDRYMNLTGRLVTLARSHRMQLDRYAEVHRLQRGQQRLLVILAHMNEENGPVSQRDLAERLHVTPAAVAVTLKRLEAEGIVSRKVLQKDNRYNEIALTQKGQEIVIGCEKAFQKTDHQLFDGFTEEELDTLENFLERMEHNLEASGEEQEA